MMKISNQDRKRSGARGRRTKQRAHRVLLVRAEDGRNWLGERFEEQGARVDAVAVYSRRSRRPSADELQRLQELIAADEKPAIVFSSTEAVAALDRQVDTAAQGMAAQRNRDRLPSAYCRATVVKRLWACVECDIRRRLDRRPARINRR